MSNTNASLQDIEIGVNAESAVMQKISGWPDTEMFRNFPLCCQDSKSGISYLQCDLILVCGYDVFVIEVKGWTGEMKLIGNYYDKEWSTEYYNVLGDRHKGIIPNIYSQNAHHIDALRNVLSSIKCKDRVRYHNVIVFTNKAITWDIKVPSDTSCIITNLDNVAGDIRKKFRESITDSELVAALRDYQNKHTEEMFFDFLCKAVSDALNNK